MCIKINLVFQNINSAAKIFKKVGGRNILDKLLNPIIKVCLLRLYFVTVM